MALLRPLSAALHEQYVQMKDLASGDAEATALADLLYDFYLAAKGLEDRVASFESDEVYRSIEDRLDLCDVIWAGYRVDAGSPSPDDPIWSKPDWECLGVTVLDTLREVRELRSKVINLQCFAEHVQTQAQQALADADAPADDHDPLAELQGVLCP
jgi:hypothetical protein